MSGGALKIICVVCGILFVLFSIFTVLSVAAEMERINTSGGIIGGMDAPMVGFLLQRSPLFDAALMLLLLFVATGAGLIFGKERKESSSRTGEETA